MEREIKGRDVNAAVRSEKLGLLKQMDDLTTQHSVVEARVGRNRRHAWLRKHACLPLKVAALMNCTNM